MTEWEYRKIALNQMSRRVDEVDLLCDAGEEGWELVAILPNNVAYMKRPVEDGQVSAATARSDDAIKWPQRADANNHAAPAAKGYEVKPKYRDPKTNETWSGRGRMANWLKSKQDAGENIDDYLV